jgi:NADPH:quinone reductase-like Zn-dependent oxidoreductase
LDHAIDYRSQDWQPVLQQLTNGRGVDLIIDPIGGAHWKKSYASLRHTGRLGMFGVSTASADGLAGKLKMLKAVIQTPWFHALPLLNRNRGVFGLNLGHMWHEPEKVAVWMRDILRGVEEGWVQPYVDQAFSFTDVGKAHQYLEERKNIGKVVLVP